MIDKTTTKTTGNEIEAGENHRNSKISEWLKQKEEIQEEIKEESFNYKKYLIITGLIIGSCFVWVYFDEIKSGSVSLWDWMQSFRGRAPDSGSSDSNSTITNTTTNNRENLISPVTSDDIELTDRQRLFSSPSIENLNSEASQSWAENLGSPTGSSTSDETVRPQITITTPPSESLLSPIEIALIDRIKLEWKNMIPAGIKARIIFIENQILLDKLGNIGIKNQIVSYLVDIEVSTDKLIYEINRLRELGMENELLQAEFLLALQNSWIERYHNIIFDN